MSRHWESNGHQRAAGDVKEPPLEDETGEEAYQRCLANAQKMNPPRVPNAGFFKNSPSAREWLKKRDRELFDVKDSSSFDADQRRRNPNYAPHPKDAHRASRSSLSPTDRTGYATPVNHRNSHPAAQMSMSATANTAHHNFNATSQGRTSTMRAADSNQPQVDLRSLSRQGPPMPMEPTFGGPTGPGRMLR